MGFSVLTNAEQQSSRVKYQKAGLRGLQYTNEHKTEGFQHVKVLQIRGVDKVRQGRVQSVKVHQGRIVECHRTQEKGSSRSKYVKSGLQRCRDHRRRGPVRQRLENRVAGHRRRASEDKVRQGREQCIKVRQNRVEKAAEGTLKVR